MKVYYHSKCGIGCGAEGVSEQDYKEICQLRAIVGLVYNSDLMFYESKQVLNNYTIKVLFLENKIIDIV